MAGKHSAGQAGSDQIATLPKELWPDEWLTADDLKAWRSVN